MRPSDKNPDAPRCPVCGKFMEAVKVKDRLKVYRCCDVERTRFRPEFTQPHEQYR